MGKNKKNIKDFQDALKSNTNFISSEDKDIVIKKSKTTDRNNDTDLLIDPELMNKIEILAKFHKKETKDLINLAIRHFLGIKTLRLEEAMEKQGTKN